MGGGKTVTQEKFTLFYDDTYDDKGGLTFGTYSEKLK